MCLPHRLNHTSASFGSLNRRLATRHANVLNNDMKGKAHRPRGCMPRRPLLGIVALTGCAPPFLSEDKSQLPMLRNDPLAAKNLLNLPLIEEHEKGFSRPLGKPSSATVQRNFEIDPSKRKEIFAAALDIAASSGWSNYFSAPTGQQTFWQGRKSNPFRICTVGIFDDHPTKLQISLTANEEP